MAEGYVVDHASVKVSPDTSGFRQKLRAELAKADDALTVDVNLDVDHTKASAELERWRQRESGRDIRVGVNVDHSALARATAAFGQLSKNMLIAGAATAGLVTASSAVGQLGSLLIAASGAAWLLPGALGAAAAAGGTVLLGADGIKKAFSAAAEEATALKDAVSSAFEKGMKPAVQDINKLLPQLKGGFTGIADSISIAAGKFTDMLTESANVGRLNGILNSTNTIVRNLGNAFAPIGEGIVAILDITTSKLATLTQGAGKTAQKFADWATSAQGIQDINRWIDNGIAAFKSLWAIAKNVGTALGGIFRGLSDGGLNLGQSLEQATGKLTGFINSAKGQSVLQELGSTLNTLASTFTDVFGAALDQLGPAFRDILPAIRNGIQNLGDGIKNALPGIKDLVGALGRLIENIAPSLPSIGSGISKIASALGWIVDVGAGAARAFGKVNESLGGLPGMVLGALGAFKLLQSRVGFLNRLKLTGFSTAMSAGLATAGTKFSTVPLTWGGKVKNALGKGLKGAGIGLLLSGALSTAFDGADQTASDRSNSTGQKIGDGVKFGLNFLGPIGIGASFANGIIEGITGVDVIGEVAKVFTGEHVSYIKEVVGKIGQDVQKSWTEQIQIMKTQNAVLAAQMGTDWKINGDKIKAFTTDTYNQIRDIIGGRTTDAKNRSTDNANKINANWRLGMSNALGSTNELWNKIFGTTQNKSGNSANKAGDNANKLSNDWRNGVNKAVGANSKGWADIFSGANAGANNAAKAANRGATLTITQWAAMSAHAFGAGQAAGNAVGDGIASAQGRAERIAANFASSVQNQLNNIIGAKSIPGVPTMPGLATGGTVTSKGNVLVGERGPEILTLSRGAQVTPLTNNDRRTVLGGDSSSSSSGGASIDYNRLAAAMAASMENVRFELDGRPVARAVNDQNRVDRRR